MSSCMLDENGRIVQLVTSDTVDMNALSHWLNDYYFNRGLNLELKQLADENNNLQNSFIMTGDYLTLESYCSQTDNPDSEDLIKRYSAYLIDNDRLNLIVAPEYTVFCAGEIIIPEKLYLDPIDSDYTTDYKFAELISGFVSKLCEICNIGKDKFKRLYAAIDNKTDREITYELIEESLAPLPELENEIVSAGEEEKYMLICKNCGKTFEKGIYCIYCGSKLSNVAKTCNDAFKQHDKSDNTDDKMESYNSKTENNLDFINEEGNKKLSPEEISGRLDETTWLGFDETTVLDSSMLYCDTPNIVRLNTNEKIYITKRNFTIGKSKNRADYTVENNVAISRVHAEIETENGEYFIIDKGSTNGTFINGTIITPNTPARILEGDELKLADETFKFYLQ